MKKFTIYSSPTCGHCTHLKEWLTAKQVEFEEIDVIADEKARNFIINKTGQMGVPVTIITDEDGNNEQIILGFDPDGISKLGELK
jgi:glutaredoxin